jgi:RND family efflux transporter MFP subunit
MKSFKKVFILGIILIVIVLAYFWSSKPEEPVKNNTNVREKPPLRRLLSAKGIVESTYEAEISSKIVGLIQEIMVTENENVERGQALVMLNSREVKAQIKEAKASWVKAKANYAKAKKDHERYKRLYKKDAITLDELEDSQTQLKAMRSEFQEADARLEYTQALLQNYTLKSPITGIITGKHLEVGEIVKQGIPILSIANINELRIRAELDETDVGGVYAGQKVKVLADAFPDRIYKAEVEKISEDVKRKRIRSFDPTSWLDINTQEITVKLESFEGLKIGMTVDVKFLL